MDKIPALTNPDGSIVILFHPAIVLLSKVLTTTQPVPLLASTYKIFAGAAKPDPS